MTAPTVAWHDPAVTALVGLTAHAAAVSAGVLRVTLSFVAPVAPEAAAGQGRVGLDWRAETLGPDEIRITTDADGAFALARLDLVLRSNGIRAVVLDDALPPAFLRRAQDVIASLGYEVTVQGSEAMSIAWSGVAEGSRGWQPAIKAATIKPDLPARLDPRTTAVVFIDVQNDFCHPEGPAGRSGDAMTLIAETLPRLRGLLSSARQAGAFVVHVLAEYGPLHRHVGSPFRFPAMGRRDPSVWTASAAELAAPERMARDAGEVCMAGTWGALPVEGMEPRQGEAVVVKHRYGAFRDTGLDVLLRANGITTVVFAGVTTNCCVESAVRESAMRDFYTVVVEDCVATKDRLRDLHEASLEHMALYFAMRRPLAALQDAWTALGVAA